jgi:hypothetical protein
MGGPCRHHFTHPVQARLGPSARIVRLQTAPLRSAPLRLARLEMVRRAPSGRYHIDEISANPSPSGHTSRRWGFAIRRDNGRVILDRTRGKPDSGHYRAVVAAWPELPDAVKAGIVAMVKAASGERCSR